MSIHTASPETWIASSPARVRGQVGAGGQPHLLPQDGEGRDGGVAAQVHLPLRGEVAELVGPLPQVLDEDGLRVLELRRQGLHQGLLREVLSLQQGHARLVPGEPAGGKGVLRYTASLGISLPVYHILGWYPQSFVEIPAWRNPRSSCTSRKSSQAAAIRSHPRAVHGEGEEPLWVAVDHMAHGLQARPVQGPGGPLSRAARGAAEHSLPQVQAGPLRLLPPAHGAGVQQRLVPRHTQQLELEGRLHQSQRLVQLVQGRTWS